MATRCLASSTHGVPRCTCGLDGASNDETSHRVADQVDLVNRDRPRQTDRFDESGQITPRFRHRPTAVVAHRSTENPSASSPSLRSGARAIASIARFPRDHGAGSPPGPWGSEMFDQVSGDVGIGPPSRSLSPSSIRNWLPSSSNLSPHTPLKIDWTYLPLVVSHRGRKFARSEASLAPIEIAVPTAVPPSRMVW